MDIFYERGLPHYLPMDATFFVTFRLANSIPVKILLSLQNDYAFEKARIEKRISGSARQQALHELGWNYFYAFDDCLNKPLPNARWLAQPELATIVYEKILETNKQLCDILALCVMSNHVHVVCRPYPLPTTNRPLIRILQKIKSQTATACNAKLGKTGQFWQRESYDHCIRTDDELNAVIKYTLENPVKVGLCEKWEDWKWSYHNIG